MSSDHPDKTCARCGRRFSWRKKWERDWAQVLYCSASCRRRKVGAADRAREERIMSMLEATPASGLPLHDLAVERDEVEDLRQAARRLAIEGRIQMLQKGRPVEPRDIRGPVEIALPPNRSRSRVRLRG